MNKFIYSVIVIVLVLIVSLIFYKNLENKDSITNVDMLVKTDGLEIVAGSEVNYFEDAKGFFVRPKDEGSYPGVVIIHENRGLRPEIKMMAEELAKEGYLVLAVDLLGSVVETQEEARILTANYDAEQGIDNMKAAVNYLKEKGAVKVASLGWCFGGAQSLQLALSGEKMDATLIYYGRLITDNQILSAITWPVFGVFGYEDQSISVQDVNLFKSSLDSLGIENEIHIYPGVGHAFANPSGVNYAPNETKDAWQKTINFLERHLK